MIEDSKEWKQVDVSHPIILGCETSSATSNKRKRQQGNYSELFFGRLQTMLSFRAISRKPSHGALVKQPAFRGSTPEAGIDFRHGRKIEKLSTLNSNPIQSPHAGWRFRQTPGKVGARGARKQEWDAKNEKTKTRPASLFLGSGVVATMVSLIGVSHYLSSNSTTSLDAAMKVDAISLRASQIVDSNLMEEGKQENCCLEEPVTGIAFLPTFDSKSFVGCGVRKRYTFFNVYAVGFYFNAEDFKDIKDEEEFEAALLNPHKHRIIKIVINRNVTMQQVVDTLKESLEPRMKGQDLQS